ncbi:MAG: hypothetical protein AABM67_18765 [Acidobacteriota bacterium]
MPSLKRLFCYSLILTALIPFCSTDYARAQSPETKPKGNGSISGRVTVGGKAAFGIIVTAMGSDRYPRRSAQTTTDSEGRYRLIGLAASTYLVTALAPALVDAETVYNSPYGGKTILLSAAEVVEDLDLKLVRGGVITGRITDDEGKPAVEERVNLDIVPDPSGRRQVDVSRLNGDMYQTDDRGIYRIYGLPPGRYKVSVGSETGGFPRNNSGRGYFAKIYYGDTTEDAKAAIVDLSEGAEATNIDIRLGHRGATFSISGRVVNSENGEPLPGLRPTYGNVSKTNPASGVFIGGLPTNSRGEFRLDRIEPGRFTIYVSSRFEGGDFYSEPIAVDVVDRDITNLEIKAVRGLTISGLVVAEGDSSKNTPGHLGGLRLTITVNTTSKPPTQNYASAVIAPDGSFRVGGLPPGKANFYMYSLENPNRRFTLTRIERDGVDQSQGFDIQAGQTASNLRLFVSYGTGVIRGTIKFENGSPPSNAIMYVGIRRDGGTGSFERGTQTDVRGHFLITDVPAGTYEITLNQGFSSPPQPGQRPRPPLKQFVSVADDSEVEVIFTVDLKPKEGGP